MSRTSPALLIESARCRGLRVELGSKGRHLLNLRELPMVSSRLYWQKARDETAASSPTAPSHLISDSVISILNAIVINSVTTSLRYYILLTTIIGRSPFPKFGVQIQLAVLCGCQVRGES